MAVGFIRAPLSYTPFPARSAVEVYGHSGALLDWATVVGHLESSIVYFYSCYSKSEADRHRYMLLKSISAWQCLLVWVPGLEELPIHCLCEDDWTIVCCTRSSCLPNSQQYAAFFYLCGRIQDADSLAVQMKMYATLVRTDVMELEHAVLVQSVMSLAVVSLALCYLFCSG